MTKLDAINNMLLGIQEQPVATIDESLEEVKVALMILENTKKLVLAEGWSFNTEEGYTLVPDIDGHITVPANTLHLDPSDLSFNYVVRGSRLYDLKNHTDVFNESVKVDIVYDLEWEDIPEYAQQYIAAKAARVFQAKTFGDPQLYQYQSVEELEAYKMMKSAEMDIQDSNFLESFTSELDWYY